MPREFITCEECGKEVVSGNKFCTNCGAELPVQPKPPEKIKFPTIKVILIIIIIILSILLSNAVHDNIISPKHNVSNHTDNNIKNYWNTKKIVSFGDFNMSVNSNSAFHQSNYSSNNTTNLYKWKDKSSDIEVYYFKNISKNDSKGIFNETQYLKNVSYDGNLVIFTSSNDNKSSQNLHDYMVSVNSENNVVMIQGSNLNTLKEYAKSIVFNK